VTGRNATNGDGARLVYRRVFLRIIPFVFICYLVAMIDRLNVGFAKLQFMSELHLSETQFGFAASLLYVGYILFEIPSNLKLQKSGIRLTKTAKPPPMAGRKQEVLQLRE
jgi:sugar phosphate permease